MLDPTPANGSSTVLIVSAVLTFLTVVFQGLMTIYMARMKAKQDENSIKLKNMNVRQKRQAGKIDTVVKINEGQNTKLEAQNDKLDTMVKRIETVREGQNGLVQQLVDAGKVAGNIEGRAELKSEQAKGE